MFRPWLEHWLHLFPNIVIMQFFSPSWLPEYSWNWTKIKGLNNSSQVWILIRQGSYFMMWCSRGSVNCVVLLLWSTKYILPETVLLTSQPGGKGPSSSQFTLLRSLRRKSKQKVKALLKIRWNQFIFREEGEMNVVLSDSRLWKS